MTAAKWESTLKAMSAKEMTMAQASFEIGASYASVYQWAKKFKIRFKSGRRGGRARKISRNQDHSAVVCGPAQAIFRGKEIYKTPEKEATMADFQRAASYVQMIQKRGSTGHMFTSDDWWVVEMIPQMVGKLLEQGVK